MSISVLIVDDDKLSRKLVERLLKRRGFDVLMAKNGDEAFQILKTERIDIVISDIRMPDGTGVELLRRLRRMTFPGGTHPCVIIVTTLITGGEHYLRALGAFEILIKPLDSTAFNDALNRARIEITRNRTRNS